MFRLEQLRNSRKVSQSHVAEYLNITQAAYSNYEKGKREPDHETLLKMSDFFGTTTDYLLGLSDDPSPPGKRPSFTAEDALRVLAAENNLSDEDRRDLDNYIKLLRFRAKAMASGEGEKASPAAYAN